jgi:hypothetical protein
VSVLWDKYGILLVHYLEKGAATTQQTTKQQLVSKHRGKLSNGILFLQENSAPCKVATMHQNLAEVLKYPDLAPLNCYSFPNLKKNLKGRKLSSTQEAILVVDRRFAA